jgi:hypothetical protein
VPHDGGAESLILSDDRPDTSSLLREAGQRYQELGKNEAEVLAIVHGTGDTAMTIEQELNLPYSVLVDKGGELHRDLGAISAHGQDAAAVYLTDCFQEMYAVYRTGEGARLPQVDEILRQLEFISFQCPECEPPEWPA